MADVEIDLVHCDENDSHGFQFAELAQFYPFYGCEFPPDVLTESYAFSFSHLCSWSSLIHGTSEVHQSNLHVQSVAAPIE